MLVTGLPGSGKTTLADRLAPVLGLPLLSRDAVKESLFDTLGIGDRPWSLRLGRAALDVVLSVLADCPRGAVVEAWLPPERDREPVARGLARAGIARPLEVFCDCPVEIAVRRYRERAGLRHPGHPAGEGYALARIHTAARTLVPLGFGPVLRVDTSAPVQVDRVASWVSLTTAEPGPQTAGRRD